MCQQNLMYSLDDLRRRMSERMYALCSIVIGRLRKGQKLALSYQPEDGYSLAFSGGKDSVVVYHLAKIAGVKFTPFMMLSSVDPPGHVAWVKKEYPDVPRILPKISIYNLSIKKGMIPSAFKRFCCREYKEYAVKSCVCLLGVRRDESRRRRKEGEMRIRGGKIEGNVDDFLAFMESPSALSPVFKSTDSVNHYMACMDGREEIIMNPIVDWTDDDVWEFHQSLSLDHSPWYDFGFTRVGCMHCPMGSKRIHEMELKLYPNLKVRWVKTIAHILGDGNMAMMRFKGMDLTKNAELVYEYWLSHLNWIEFCRRKGLTPPE